MSGKKEFVANSLKDAIQKAAEDFGIEEEKLKYRIITEKTKYSYILILSIVYEIKK